MDGPSGISGAPAEGSETRKRDGYRTQHEDNVCKGVLRFWTRLSMPGALALRDTLRQWHLAFAGPH